MTFRYRLDTSRDPMHIDVFTDEDDVHKGIFRIDGSTLIKCFPVDEGDDRPTAFLNDKNRGWFVYHYKRATKDRKASVACLEDK